ncbi:hypothetical protein TSOC_011975 [Tetrabaena socialis]|uniref:DM2 domain-containing protein n=1 Tax=Tetrabaena socialis TaxID=47790 RepID=A0A2J7ZP92_9CHLO|nr:hypothetical protein TSOC_011975 [Tetrabaena socialis]|eukprot:PNH02080.1 hypothetical protein TSOC_011975 [Tetrabaena socialis]
MRRSIWEQDTQCAISDQLADFLHISRGTRISRVAVTRLINEYIKARNLRDPQDRYKILPDKGLADLFGATTGVTFFNYHHFLTAHFRSRPTIFQSRTVDR